MSIIQEFLNRLFGVIQREKFFIILIIFLLFFYSINFSAILPSSPSYKENKEIIQDIQTEVEIALSGASLFEKIRQDDLFRRLVYSFLVISILFFLGGIFLNLYHFFSTKELDFARVQKISVSQWSLLDVIKVAIIIVLAGRLIYVFKNIIFSLHQVSTYSNFITSLVVSTFIHILGIGCLFYYIRNKYNTVNLYSLGLIFRKFFKNILLGVLGYIGIIPLALIGLIISVLISYYIGYESEPSPLFLVYFLSTKQSVMIYLLLFISIIGPICEEIFFRGFFYRVLRSKFNIRIGILVSSIIFSFLHGEPVGFLPIFLLSIMLTYLYEKTGSLVAPITAHIIHNTTVSAFMLLLRGLVL